ncbi:MAG: hypothetical protein EU531_06910 [Promethearchaeota archaeon]|nr:MAG: hypothetical protein EU531_06910 [Candidatus Lokiarchaeota archaeon]
MDFTVRGEGEHTFKEIIDYLDGNKEQTLLKDINGISYLYIERDPALPNPIEFFITIKNLKQHRYNFHENKLN